MGKLADRHDAKSHASMLVRGLMNSALMSEQKIMVGGVSSYLGVLVTDVCHN